MGREKQSHDRPICGHPKKQGGICRQVAGWGTKHPGTGNCRKHGGAGGAPKGNKNSLKTGRYESILLDVLEEEERELYAAVDTNSLALVEEELRLITLRERRMLKRIAALNEAGPLTLTEETTEVIGDDETDPTTKPGFSDRWASEMPAGALDAAEGEGKVIKVKSKREGTLGQIQSIERDLTAVQAQKRSLIDLKHKLETSGKTGEGDDDFDGSLFEGDDDDEDDGASS